MEALLGGWQVGSRYMDHAACEVSHIAPEIQAAMTSRPNPRSAGEVAMNIITGENRYDNEQM
jgi:hypothetical protein